MKIVLNTVPTDGLYKLKITAEFWGERAAREAMDYVLDAEQNGWTRPEPEVRYEAAPTPARPHFEEEQVRVAARAIYAHTRETGDGTPTIRAIKLVRALTDLGLREAKDQVEQWVRDGDWNY